MKRRSLLGAGALAGMADWTGSRSAWAEAPQKKVLRYAFRVAESGFDPVQISDAYSRTITPHIFEALYQYDPLARPVKVRPLTAMAMPETSADFRTWTVKVRPGIYFADDPAFKGKRRELTAADYVFSYKRFADPTIPSPTWPFIEDFRILGLSELRQDAIQARGALDYDRPIEGLRALDRYTIQFRLAEPRPRFLWAAMATSDINGAVAREVVEHYGRDIAAHPVGTGPFQIAQWRRSSLIVLERNPGFREMLYAAEPAADDAEGQAILARLKGRRLPMIDRVEISIIEENQPRWLSFLQGQADFLDEVPAEFIDQAMSGGRAVHNLARQGIVGYRMVWPLVDYAIFNMEDPTIGGYTPEKVALRRAIGLGYDSGREIRLVRHGQGIVANSQLWPHTYGYDPAFRSEAGSFDPARAKALLELYGYRDLDGDGWREMPDGSTLVVRIRTQSDQVSRQLDEGWRHDMTELGIRTAFTPAQWPENSKAVNAGNFQVWNVGNLAGNPDGGDAFSRLDSRRIGGQNAARFRMPELDALLDRMSLLPNGEERLALMAKATRIALAYEPYKVRINRYVSDLAQPWLIGYRRPLFWADFWQYLDIDLEEQRRRGKPV